MSSEAKIAYVGPSGAGLGFRMNGIDVTVCDDTEKIPATLKEIKEAGEHPVICVDERIAQDHLESIERMNEDPIPAIILLPNPVDPLNLTQETMKDLMIRAVGSDITNN